jgi:membrane-associated protein
MFELFQHIIHLDFKWIVETYGTAIYLILFLVIFIETGLVLMPFLPGDSLLFTAGLFAASGELDITTLLTLLTIAAVLGDNSNYWIGRKIGLRIFNLKIKGRQLVNEKYLQKTEAFFEKRGVFAIIIARFVPIVRNFTPFADGIGKMNYSRFLFYDIMGGIIWIFSVTLIGYSMGNITWIRENNEKVILLIIFISIMPMLFSYFKAKFAKKDA